jgi:hypothetical protein
MTKTKRKEQRDREKASGTRKQESPTAFADYLLKLYSSCLTTIKESPKLMETHRGQRWHKVVEEETAKLETIKKNLEAGLEIASKKEGA